MIIYKPVVCQSQNWRDRKAATLGVSVSSSNWQDDKFESILDFASAHFEVIRIDVTDALYRHNFMAKGVLPDQALKQANALGALWLTQHQNIIDACRVQPMIVRWAEWYEHPDYADTLAGFQRAHQVNAVLRNAVYDDAMEFFRRQQQTPSLTELEGSKNFMIEEMAVLTLQARALPSLKIYPGREWTCLNAVRSGLVAEAPKGLELEQYARIKLERRANIPSSSAAPTSQPTRHHARRAAHMNSYDE